MEMTIFNIPDGWAFVASVTGDASFRQYARIAKNGRSAILMDCRHERTDRPGMDAFIKIGTWLKAHGIHTPEIYDVNTDEKYLILEDFGQTSFLKAMSDGTASEKELYTLSANVLAHLRTIDDLPDLSRYEDSFIHEKHADIIRIYYPYIRPGDHDVMALETAYRSVWEEIESKLPPCPRGIVHGDYHIENMMYLPQNKGLARLGLIDFQDAMIGPAPYDYTHILKNVRRTVCEDIQNHILHGFDEDFLAWYQVLALQWHCRVLGLFIDLHVNYERDQYMQHIPRIEAYMKTALKNEIFKPLTRFFDDLGLSFS
jgi:aminoglycoside/choline kinase family phosphotransferase